MLNPVYEEERACDENEADDVRADDTCESVPAGDAEVAPNDVLWLVCLDDIWFEGDVLLPKNGPFITNNLVRDFDRREGHKGLSCEVGLFRGVVNVLDLDLDFRELLADFLVVVCVVLALCFLDLFLFDETHVLGGELSEIVDIVHPGQFGDIVLADCDAMVSAL